MKGEVILPAAMSADVRLGWRSATTQLPLCARDSPAIEVYVGGGSLRVFAACSSLVELDAPICRLECNTLVVVGRRSKR